MASPFATSSTIAAFEEAHAAERVRWAYISTVCLSALMPCAILSCPQWTPKLGGWGRGHDTDDYVVHLHFLDSRIPVAASYKLSGISQSSLHPFQTQSKLRQTQRAARETVPSPRPTPFGSEV